MPLIAILIDLITLGGYFLQLNNGAPTLYLLGLIFQTIMTVLLLIIMIGYHGKKYSGFRPEGYSYLTIRYGIIVLSFVLNGIALFLYGLNYFGINDIVFSGF
ncbi:MULTISPECIES: hypothetical protein [Enterococcus]|uniref:hypothetical protein n=1 Tax=Enterococcus TaxID=1350 RepID=UPI000ED9A6F1|nr:MULTISPECIES: hypothetical protein [Enterococcus]HCM85132.1 hypothetical protein [Enterococcus sp.]